MVLHRWYPLSFDSCRASEGLSGQSSVAEVPRAAGLIYFWHCGQEYGKPFLFPCAKRRTVKLPQVQVIPVGN
jgi:hypothetical protein